LALGLVSACSKAQQVSPLIGTWERISLSDAKGKVSQVPDSATFLIISDDGYFAQTTIPGGRPSLSKSLGEMTKEELLGRFQGLVARYGTYRTVKNIFIRSDLSHSDPAEEGGEQVQAFRIEGDLLILTDPAPGDKTEARFRRIKREVDAPPDPGKIVWLKANQELLRTIDPRDADFKDLLPLKKLIGSSRVVMLGEQTHGDGAAFDAKTRLIRFLHEEMGFNVLAFESGLYDCEVGDTLLSQGKPAAEALDASIFGIWAGGEKMLPLFDYLAATKKTSRPIMLTGFDIQFSSSAWTPSEFADRLMAGLESIDKDLAKEDTKQMLMRLAKALYGGNFEELTKEERQSHGRKLAGLLDKVKSCIGDRNSRDNDFTLRLLLNLMALEQFKSISLEQGFSTETWDASNLRDNSMADNLLWLLESRYRGEKIIAWAASMHIARDVPAIDTKLPRLNYARYRTMGQGVWDELKEQMYAIAFTAYDGAYGNPWSDAWALAPATAASLEGMFHATGVPLSFLDFRSLPADHWLREPMFSRPLGNAMIVAVWPRHFDAMIFTETMYPNPRRADLK